jgi:septal ring factor EnvC (AmiA/AmiB activator)
MSLQKLTLAAAIAALFPTSEKAISEKLTQEEFNAFSGEAQEVQNRLDAQATGNQAVADDLVKANATLKETQDKLTAAESARDQAQGDLTKANATVTELTPKASAWDAHKAALGNTNVIDDTTNGKGKNKPDASGLTEKEQARITENQRLATKYPGLMAGIDVGTPAEQE